MTQRYTPINQSDGGTTDRGWIIYQGGEIFRIEYHANLGPADAIRHLEWTLLVQQADGRYAEHPTWPVDEVGRFLSQHRLALFDRRGNLVR